MASRVLEPDEVREILSELVKRLDARGEEAVQIPGAGQCGRPGFARYPFTAPGIPTSRTCSPQASPSHTCRHGWGMRPVR